MAYQPAWRGQMLWDDDLHITPRELRSSGGLWRIWTDLGATQQYYPILYSALWIEHHLWGDEVLGYHLTNIVLHALSAYVLALVMRRLGIGGAALAAVIFLLHPVHVESVAWITEQKNTLSGLLLLGASLAYVRFDESRSVGQYVLACGLFAAALLSKTTTAMLPPALLVVVWWRRGRIDLRRDVLPLGPLLLAAGAAGLFTAWFEKAIVGAAGTDFAFTPVERCLMAGRAILFYLFKLIWPVNLWPVYPRWVVDQSQPWQYGFPVAVLGVLVGLWLIRKRTRSPLAAMLVFCVMLLPAIGFFDVYMFVSTLVADRWQYLASLGVICLFAGVVSWLIRRVPSPQTAVRAVVAVAVAVVLGVLTFRQSRHYATAEAYYRAAVAGNDTSFAAHYGLGTALEAGGDLAGAASAYRRVLELRKDHAVAHSNLASVLARQNKLSEAEGHCHKAIALDPDMPAPYVTLANILSARGEHEAALVQCRKALDRKGDDPGILCSYGTILHDLRRYGPAIEEFRKAIRIDPEFFLARYNLGNSLSATERFEEAAKQYEQAISLNPQSVAARSNLGAVMRRLGRHDRAIEHYTAALAIDPGSPGVHMNLANALAESGQLDRAIASARQAVTLAPGDAVLRNALGKMLLAAGRLWDASWQFEKAVQLAPDYQEARRHLRAVQATLKQGGAQP